MQRYTCDMWSQEEEEEARNISSSSTCKCSGSSSIHSSHEQVKEGAGCIATKALQEPPLTHMSISLHNEFLQSSGNALARARDAVTCTTAGKAIKCDGASLIRPRRKEEDEDTGDDDNNEGGITPRAHEHRIPCPLVCPPPPHKKLKKKQRIDQVLGSPAMKLKAMSNFYDYTTHNFFNPPPDLHTYPDCIKALFKS